MTPRFGVSLRTTAEEGADPATEARHAEQMGFELITVSDHLPGSRPSFETWTVLTWLAAATTRIKVGTNVLGLPYRHPAVTAKMAESLHRLSGGRLVLGLGAGGSNEEFTAFGLPVRRPGEKVEALAEAIDIIRGLWSGEPVSRDGRHYRVEQARIAPAPSAPIPLWLGTYGPKALALTGRVADGWLPSMRFAPPERWKQLRERVRRGAEGAGRDPDEIEYAYNVGVRVDERAQARQGMVAGGPEQVADELAALAGMGITFLNLWPSGDGTEQRERLANEVIPEVTRLSPG